MVAEEMAEAEEMVAEAERVAEAECVAEAHLAEADLVEVLTQVLLFQFCLKNLMY
jgi:hypothetical protein